MPTFWWFKLPQITQRARYSAIVPMLSLFISYIHLPGRVFALSGMGTKSQALKCDSFQSCFFIAACQNSACGVFIASRYDSGLISCHLFVAVVEFAVASSSVSTANAFIAIHASLSAAFCNFHGRVIGTPGDRVLSMKLHHISGLICPSCPWLIEFATALGDWVNREYRLPNLYIVGFGHRRWTFQYWDLC